MSKTPPLACLILIISLALRGPGCAEQAAIKSEKEAAYAALLQEGDKAMAEKRTGDAVEAYAKAVGLTSPEHDSEVWAMAVTLLADALLQKGEKVKAHELARSVLGLDQRSKIRNQWTIGHAAWTVGLTLMNAGHGKEAEPYFRLSLDAAEKYGGANHAGVAYVLQGLALCLRDQQRYAEAEFLLRRAIGIDGRTGEGRNPDLARDLCQLGIVLTDAGLSVDSEELLRHALAIDEANGAEGALMARDLQALTRCLLLQVKDANAFLGNRRRPKADGTGKVTALMPPLRDPLEAVRPAFVHQKLAQAEGYSSRCVQALVKLRGQTLPDGLSESKALAIHKSILMARRMTPSAIEANIKALTAKADS